MSSPAHPRQPDHVHLSGRPALDAEHAGQHDPADHAAVTIDCDRCTMRGIGCADCVVTVLLGGPPYGVELDDVERHAIAVLSDAGLVPPLRMVEPVDTPMQNRDLGD
jgi:hypothetical protein